MVLGRSTTRVRGTACVRLNLASVRHQLVIVRNMGTGGMELCHTSMIESAFLLLVAFADAVGGP